MGPPDQREVSDGSSGRHSIWGRVVDANGKGVPRAEVYWVAARHAGKESVELFETHWVALADAEGRFWAPGLPSGRCLLVPDFQRIAVAGDKVRLDHAMPVTLPLPEGELVVPLPYSGASFVVIRGRVYDEADRSPIAGHLMAVLDPEKRAVVRQMVTGPDGSFAFGLLRPGKYVLGALGTSRYLGGGNPVELTGGQTVNAQVGLHRRPAGPRHIVRVRVEDELGLPVTGVPVQFSVPDIETLVVPTDEEGRAEATDLPERPTAVMVGVIEFSPRGTVVPPGDPGVPVELTISLQRTLRMRVAARDAESGKLLRHANICVSHGGGDYWSWGGVLPAPGAPEKDHSDVVVLPGRVTVRAESPGYEGARQEVEVTSGMDAPSVTLDLVHREA
ncbi:MAG: hypothetical protein K8T90_08805 [Planctomycetes bacterium]|nr:hypothetical protein [Planctomycetota bacterium]